MCNSKQTLCHANVDKSAHFSLVVFIFVLMLVFQLPVLVKCIRQPSNQSQAPFPGAFNANFQSNAHQPTPSVFVVSKNSLPDKFSNDLLHNVTPTFGTINISQPEFNHLNLPKSYPNSVDHTLPVDMIGVEPVDRGTTTKIMIPNGQFTLAPVLPFNDSDNPNEINRNQTNDQFQNGTQSNVYGSPSDHSNRSVHQKRFELAKFDFGHVSTPYVISLWIIIVGFAKIGFHMTPKLNNICPESVVLMILGVLIGFMLFYGGIQSKHPSGPTDAHDASTMINSLIQPLTPNLFFLYMMPPIVMDAGYHMPNRLFFDNLGSITLYAVVGTVWNALTIGFALFACSEFGLFGVQLSLLDTLLFSSIVSAVDPVAVLAVFEEIHVNEVLYILVFGESLLNDAVTVVLYHMFEAYSEMGLQNLRLLDYFIGFLSFFVVSLGGILMGVVWGFATAFVSRFTHHVKIIEPIFVFVMAYLAYLSAEMFFLSGILSLTFCGLTMKNYVEENITETSQVTLKYAMKMLANASESIIFLFLGVCTVNDSHDWNTLFVALTIVFCLIFRTLGVIMFTAIANHFRLHKISAIEQFIMSYGGLRGAVAFALVLVVNENIIPTKKMMITTVIALVYFTVFLQGMTVGPLVNLLKVPRSNKYELTLNERIHTRFMDHLMAGIEDISGFVVGNYKLRDKFRRYNNMVLKRWFLRHSRIQHSTSRKIFETHSRLNLQDALKLVSTENLCDLYNNKMSPNRSLSDLLRTCTQINLNLVDNHNSTEQVKMRTLSDSEIDLTYYFDTNNLNYVVPNKDLKEAYQNHCVNDCMFAIANLITFEMLDKNNSGQTPTELKLMFDRQVKLQLKQLVNLHQKLQQLTNGQPNVSNVPSDALTIVVQSDCNATTHNNNEDPQPGNQTTDNARGSVPMPNRDLQTIQAEINRSNESDSDSEDAGITFTARINENNAPNCKAVSVGPPDHVVANGQDAQEQTTNHTNPQTNRSVCDTSNRIQIKICSANHLKTTCETETETNENQVSVSCCPPPDDSPWINNKEYFVEISSPDKTCADQCDNTGANKIPPDQDIIVDEHIVIINPNAHQTDQAIASQVPSHSQSNQIGSFNDVNHNIQPEVDHNHCIKTQEMPSQPQSHVHSPPEAGRARVECKHVIAKPQSTAHNQLIVSTGSQITDHAYNYDSPPVYRL